MNKELKDKWIAALRSGDYKQGQGRLLREVDGEYEYCCLGVLCDVMGYEKDLKDEGFISANHLMEATLSNQEIKELGLHKKVQLLGRQTILERKLIHMNDGVETPRKTFDEIANYLERINF